MTKGLSKQEIAAFCDQLRMLLASGAPLLQALQIANRLAKKPGYFDRLIAKVEQGEALSVAFSGYFPPLVTSSLHSAERAGNLEEVLRQLSSHYEAEVEQESKIKSALVYPLFIVVLCLISLLVMVVFVLPGFKSLLSDMEGELPLLTRIMIGFGEALANYWFIPVAAVLPLKVMGKRYRQTDRGKRQVDQLLFKIGPIRRAQTMPCFRSLGSLLRGGVPINRALQTVAAAAPNLVLREKLSLAGGMVENGELLSQSLKQQGLLTEELSRIVAVGENTGQLAEMLLGVANYYDKEQAVSIKRYTALLEPVLTLTVGLFVGLLALSMFLPLINMLSKLQ
jgi:type II secretory pathway component PulF